MPKMVSRASVVASAATFWTTFLLLSLHEIAMVRAVVSLTCGIANVVNDPLVSETYLLSACGSATTTSITVKSSTFARTIFVQAGGAATPCYIQSIVVEGAQSNLKVSLQGVTMSCGANACIDLSTATLSSVTVAATAFSGATNVISSTGNAIVNAASGTNFNVQLDSSTVTSASSTVSLTGAFSTLTFMATGSTLSCGSGSLLRAAGAVSSVSLGLNSANLVATTTSITTTTPTFYFEGSVTGGLQLYAGAGTTITGLAASTSFLSFTSGGVVASPQVSISSASLSFGGTTTCVFCVVGDVSGFVLSVYGGSTINSGGRVVSISGSMSDSTLTVKYAATSSVSSTHILVDSTLSSSAIDFSSSTSGLTSTILLSAALISSTSLSCASITTSNVLLTIGGTGIANTVTLDATSCSCTGSYVSSASTASLTSLSVSLTSSGLNFPTGSAFIFSGPLATSTMTLTGTTVTAKYYARFLSSATTVSMSSLSSSFVTATNYAVGLEHATLTSTGVQLYATASSTFTAPAIFTVSGAAANLRLDLDASAQIFASTNVLDANSASIDSFTIVGGSSTLISVGNVGVSVNSLSAFGLLLTASGASYTHNSAKALVMISGASSGVIISIASGASLASAGSNLVDSAGTSSSTRLTVVGGTLSTGSFFSSSGTASGITVTASASAAVTWTNPVISSSGTVSTLDVRFNGCTATASGGVVRFSGTSGVNSDVTFYGSNFNAASSFSTYLISSAAPISSFSISLSGAFTISTAQSCFTSTIFDTGTISIASSFTLQSAVNLLAASNAVSNTGISISGASVASSVGDSLSMASTSIVTVSVSSSTWTSDSRLLVVSGTSSSVAVSITGSTISAATASVGALNFGSTSSDTSLTMTGVTATFPSSSLFRAVGAASGTNSFNLDTSTVSCLGAPMLTFEAGFQGTLFSLLLSSITVTAKDQLLYSDHQLSATSLQSTISLTSSSITLQTSAAGSGSFAAPSLAYIASAPTLIGSVWTVTNCAIEHKISVVPTNAVTLSYFALIGSSVSITTSIGPTFSIVGTSITSQSAHLSTFWGLRFDGTGSATGHSNPYGTIWLEQLSYSLSTAVIALIMSSPTYPLYYMNVTVRCVTVPTTSSDLLSLRGIVNEVHINFLGVYVASTSANVAAIAMTNAGNSYIEATFLNSMVHTPMIIQLAPSLLTANPTPANVILIYVGCSKASHGYTMSGMSFVSPLHTAVTATPCYLLPYASCVDTVSRSRSTTLSDEQTWSRTVSNSPSDTHSLSSELTESHYRTWTNYSLSNSSDLSRSVTQSQIASLSLSSTSQRSRSRTTTISGSSTLSASLTTMQSQTMTESTSVTASRTYTSTASLTSSVTASLVETPTKMSSSLTLSATPSMTDSVTQSQALSDSITDSVSSMRSRSASKRSQTMSFTRSTTSVHTRSETTSTTQSLSTTPTEAKSRSDSETVSQSTTESESDTPAARSRTHSTTISGSMTPSVIRSASRSVSLSSSLTLSQDPSMSFSNSNERSATPSTTKSLSKTNSSSPSLSASPTPSLSMTNALSDTRSESAEVTNSETSESTKSSSKTVSESRTHSLTVAKSASRTGTPSFSNSQSPSRSKSASPLESATVTLSQQISVTMDSLTQSRSGGSRSPTKSISPSGSQTVTLTDEVTLSKATWTYTVSVSTSGPTLSSDVTLTESPERTTPSTSHSLTALVTGTPSYSQSRSVTRSGSLSNAPPTATRSATLTTTLTASITTSKSPDASTSLVTNRITPTQATITISTSLSGNTVQASMTETKTRFTPSRSVDSPTSSATATVTNSSSATQQGSMSHTRTHHTPTRTYTISGTSDVTLTETNTVTPPKTLTATRTITGGLPAPLSNLQAVVGFFGDYFSNGQHCTAPIWYVLAVCALLALLQAVVIGSAFLLGGCLEKHPETREGISVIRSLIVHSTYLSVFLPCHYRCALNHTLIALFHMALLMTLYYVASVRLYLSDSSPTSLKVIVALSCAVAPHLITRPLRLQLFRFEFNVKKLEKAWLKYCDLTGRHQSRQYFPTVKPSDPLKSVLALSKTKVVPTKEQIEFEKGLDEYHAKIQHAAALKARGYEQDTFEFDASPPATASNAGGIIRVMSTRRLEPPVTNSGSSGGRGGGGEKNDSDDDDEKTMITVVTTDNEPSATKKKKSKKKGKKGKKKGKSSADPPSRAPVMLEGVGGTEAHSSSSDDGEGRVSPSSTRARASATSGKAAAKGSDSNPTAASTPTSGAPRFVTAARGVTTGKATGGGFSSPSDTASFGFGLTTAPNDNTNNKDVLSSSRGGGKKRNGPALDDTISFGGTSSIDMEAIFGSLDDPSASASASAAGGGGKGGAGGEMGPYVPSIVVSGAHERTSSLVDDYQLDLDFAELGDDDEEPVEHVVEDKPVSRGTMLGIQRGVFEAFATPRQSPAGGGTAQYRPPQDRDALVQSRQEELPTPRFGGTTAFKVLHGIDDPFMVSSSDEEDAAAAEFKKASAPPKLLDENDPFGFRDAVAGATEQQATNAQRRGSNSFKLHPLKDPTKAVITGGISEKVVQHNLEDRWERRSDEWSLPSASDSTDTEGDDEEGREYFPAPILTFHSYIGLVTLVLLVLTCIALFYSIRGVHQPDQLCVTSLLFVTYLVDALVVELLAALLILMHRIWWFDEDGSHDRRAEHHSWRYAIREHCELHPFQGELREHMIPPLKRGKKRNRHDEPYQFGLPKDQQPKMEVPKPPPPPQQRTRLPRWE